MSGDYEGNRQYRYVGECSECGATVSTLSTGGSRKPGRWVQCETALASADGGEVVWRCGVIVWATDAAESRPPRWQGRPPDPDELIGVADPAKVEGSV